MDAIWWIIWATIIMTGAGWVIVKFVEKLIFKHKVRVIELGKQNLELDFKARNYNKDGVLYWQLDKERNKELRNMPVPPAEAIHIAKRGKKSVEVVRTPTGEYIFLERNINLTSMPNLNEGIPNEILKLKDLEKRKALIKKYQAIKLKKWKLENKGIILANTYQPFTSKERMVIVHNFEKAKARRGFSLKEHILPIVSIGGLVLVLICLIIFMGDLAKPYIDEKKIQTQYMETQKEVVEILREIRLEQQTIKAEQDGGG